FLAASLRIRQGEAIQQKFHGSHAPRGNPWLCRSSGEYAPRERAGCIPTPERGNDQLVAFSRPPLRGVAEAIQNNTVTDFMVPMLRVGTRDFAAPAASMLHGNGQDIFPRPTQERRCGQQMQDRTVLPLSTFPDSPPPT